MRSAFAAALCTAAFGASAQSYTPPRPLPGGGEFEAVMDKAYEAAWSTLLDRAARAEFSIRQADKAAGLLRIAFGTVHAEEYVDCGTIAVWGTQSCDGPFVKCAREYVGATLAGELLVYLKPEGEGRTRVRATAQYEFRVPRLGTRPEMVWRFTTGQQATVKSPQPLVGTEPERTCGPTHRAEQMVLDALARD